MIKLPQKPKRLIWQCKGEGSLYGLTRIILIAYLIEMQAAYCDYNSSVMSAHLHCLTELWPVANHVLITDFVGVFHQEAAVSLIAAVHRV